MYLHYVAAIHKINYVACPKMCPDFCAFFSLSRARPHKLFKPRTHARARARARARTRDSNELCIRFSRLIRFHEHDVACNAIVNEFFCKCPLNHCDYCKLCVRARRARALLIVTEIWRKILT